MAKEASVGWSLAELAELLGGTPDGPLELRIERPVPAGSHDPQGLTFAENDEYLSKLGAGSVAAVLAMPGADTRGIAAIRVAHPRRAFGHFLNLCQRPLPIEPGIHATAVVAEGAEVDPSASVGAYAVIEREARVGARCRVYPFAFVGERCVLAEGVTVYPHAVLYQDVTVGKGSVIHAGAILGADGFGFAWDGTKQHKIAQVGTVVLGDEVEIGANTTVDRATAGATQIGDGTKLDNLVMIGHNTVVGDHTVIAALCGIAGSSSIGSRVTMAGQVATSDHRTVTDDVTLGGRSGVTKDITMPGVYWGFPARPMLEATRVMVLTQRLPEIYERLRALEEKLQALEGGSS